MNQQGFQKGDFVRKKQNPGNAASIIDGPVDDAGDYLWKVRLPDGSIRNWLDGTFELVPQKENIEDLLRERKFGRKSDFSQLLTFHRLDQPLTNNIYSLHSNRIDFHPFQFKPLLKFIDSPNQRLLIADDVGLGKTIEAGLILSELKLRASLQKVLITCPAHLREKWRMEMSHRFGEEFKVLDAAKFRQFLKDYKKSNGQIPVRIICSMQSMRSDRILRGLEEIDPRFELVIVDEAHYMRNSDTKTHALGQLLANQAEAMIFLTATPVQTQLENLYNLLKILDQDHFQSFNLFERQLKTNKHVLKAEAALSKIPPDWREFTDAVDEMGTTSMSGGISFKQNPIWENVHSAAKSTEIPSRRDLVELRSWLTEMNLLGDSLTRTRKTEVSTNIAVRKPQVLKVVYTEKEKQIYNRVLDYVRSRYDMRGTFFEKAALMMPQRRTASSILGSAHYYLSGDKKSDIDDYLASLDEGSGDLPDDLPDQYFGLKQLFRGAAASNINDSKYEALLTFIQKLQINEKLIIFSTFPSTLEYLSSRLGEDGFRGVTISGKVPVNERPEMIDSFRDDSGIRILFSSEVGGEGLDMQFCNIIVNYDLPWNPMAVAQRIGRLDRIGQRSPVIRIVNFSVEGTIDQVILERLYNRIQLFEQSIGLTDGILGSVLENIADALLSNDLSERASKEKLEKERQALESKIQVLNQINESSDRILISDTFLEDKVNQANKLHRYVSDSEVHTLVTEFLAKFYPRTLLVKQDGYQLTYKIKADRELRAVFGSHRFRYEPGDRPPNFIFLPDLAEITFSADTANRHARLEYINLNHPLVRLVVQHYRKAGHDFSRTSFFKASSSIAREGTYLLLIHKLFARGVRSRVLLLPIAICLETLNTLDEEESEILAAEAITSGTDVKHLEKVPESLPIEPAYKKAISILGKRDSELRKNLQIRDEAFRSRRISSLEAYYDRRTARQKTLANEHKLRGSSTSVIKGFLTRATNLQKEREDRIVEIETGQQFDPETEAVLAAVVDLHD